MVRHHAIHLNFHMVGLGKVVSHDYHGSRTKDHLLNCEVSLVYWCTDCKVLMYLDVLRKRFQRDKVKNGLSYGQLVCPYNEYFNGFSLL